MRTPVKLSLLVLGLSIAIAYLRPEWLPFNIGTGGKSDNKQDGKFEPQLQPNPDCLPGGEVILTPEELSKFRGNPTSPGLYLAFLGIVYDVGGKGSKHYGPGGGYAFFAGRDSTRSFMTGDFTDEKMSDDVTGLDVESFNGLREWSAFYEKDYKRVGRVVGTYYDKEGCPTDKVKYVEDMYKRYDDSKADEADLNKIFPPCNSEWSGDTKRGRVWCSTQSGGEIRDWVGVPRKLFVKKHNTHKCVCVRNTGQPSISTIVYADDETGEEAKPDITGDRNVGDLANPLLREYPNCPRDSFECQT